MLKLEGVSTAKIVLFHQGSIELQRCENCVFVLPVNNYLIKNSQAVKKGAAPIKAMVKKDVKSKVAAEKWL